APAYPRGNTQGSRPDYGAPAGWSAPGWPPRDQPQSPPAERGYGGQPEQPRGAYPGQDAGGYAGDHSVPPYDRGQGDPGRGPGEDPGHGTPSWDSPNGRQ